MTKNTARASEASTADLLIALDAKHAPQATPQAPDSAPAGTRTFPAGSLKAIFERPAAYAENAARLRLAGVRPVHSFVVWILEADGTKSCHHAYSFSGPDVEPVYNHTGKMPFPWVPFAVPGFGTQQLPTAPRLYFQTVGELKIWATEPRKDAGSAPPSIEAKPEAPVTVDVPKFVSEPLTTAFKAFACALPARASTSGPDGVTVASDYLRALIRNTQVFDSALKDSGIAETTDPRAIAEKLRKVSGTYSRSAFMDLPDSPSFHTEGLTHAWQTIRDHLRVFPLIPAAQSGAYNLGELANAVAFAGF
jgi:hypothetical protein